MAPGHLTGHEGYERVAHGTGYVLQDRQDDDKMGRPKGNWKEGGKMIDSPCLGSRNCTHGRASRKLLCVACSIVLVMRALL